MNCHPKVVRLLVHLLVDKVGTGRRRRRQVTRRATGHQRHRGGGGVPARRRPPRSPPPRRPSPRPTPLKQRWAPAASIANGVGAPGLRRATGHRRHVGGGGVPSRRRSPRSPPREARWAQPAMPLREGDVRTFGLLSAGERRLGHVGAVWSVSSCRHCDSNRAGNPPGRASKPRFATAISIEVAVFATEVAVGNSGDRPKFRFVRPQFAVGNSGDRREFRSADRSLRLEIAVIDRSFGRKPRWSTAVCG